MNTLHKFYIKAVAAVAIAVALAAYFIPVHLVPYAIHSNWNSSIIWLLEHSANRIVIVAVLAGAEWYIRKQLWRWKLFHAELDFSGKWAGSTVYSHVHVGSISEIKKKVIQDVTIVQDCLSIRLIPSAGKDFVFKSRCIDIQDNGTQLVYAYHVTYNTDVPDRPKESHGFEWLNVLKYTKGGKPEKLKGRFAHCADGQSPVLSGEVDLTRISN